MSRLLRRFAAVTAIAALVFSQLAVSAAACPHESGSPTVAQMPAGHSGDDCGQMGNPNLCERHCDYGSSTVPHAAAASPVLPAAELPWRIEPAKVVAVSRGALARFNLDSHPPPPLILLGVLRI